MPLVEGTATAVLTGESHGNAIEQERAEGQRLRHAVIERQFSCAHLFPLLQQLFYLGVDGETIGIAGELFSQLTECLVCNSGCNFKFRFVTSTNVLIPIAAKDAQHRRLLHGNGLVVGSVDLRAESRCHLPCLEVVLLIVTLKERRVGAFFFFPKQPRDCFISYPPLPLPPGSPHTTHSP